MYPDLEKLNFNTLGMMFMLRFDSEKIVHIYLSLSQIICIRSENWEDGKYLNTILTTHGVKIECLSEEMVSDLMLHCNFDGQSEWTPPVKYGFTFEKT
jgi:hypothetical protein